MLAVTLLPASRAIYESAVMIRPVPNMHHYTTFAGMAGILESRTIWASDCRFLNDASELVYAESVIRKVTQTEAAALDAPLRDYLDKFSFVVAYISSRMPVHVASFCQEGDNLCQWREYGRTGVSVGISGSALAELPDCHIVKVEYRPEIQEQLIRETLHAHVPSFEEAFRSRDQDAIVRISGFLSAQLMYYATAFKHPAFADEKEWRAVTGAAPERLSTRRTGKLDQPYVELSLEVRLGDGIELVSVLHSPFLNGHEALSEVRRILTSHGYDASLAGSSTAPIRLLGGA